jgi:hypothetical protein
MPVSFWSRNACATSTYSATTTRAGTSLRDDNSNAPARSTARSSASTRFNGQPPASAWSIIGSRRRWSSSTPRTTLRKNAASAGRYCEPSTSRPIQWLSNSARMSFSGVAAMSI